MRFSWLKNPFLPAILAALILLMLSQQVRLLHLLAMSYLFWGYLLSGLIIAVGTWTLLAAREKLPGFLLLIVLIGAFVWPWWHDYQRNNVSDQQISGRTLKVITYNWLQDPHDRGPAYDWIRQQSPDILAIEEFHADTPDVAGRLYSVFPYRSKPAGDTILLSKYPIVGEWNPTGGDREQLHAKLNIDGHPLRIAIIHPQTLRDADELADRNAYFTRANFYLKPDTDSKLLLGDFNATRWEPALQALMHSLNLHEEPRLVPLATRMGVRSKLSFVGAPIDHIMTNGHNQLSNCHTGPSLGSDHLPLICDLRLTN